MFMYLSPTCKKVDHDIARVSHIRSDDAQVVTVNVQMEISAPVQRQSNTTSLSDVTQRGSYFGLGL